MRTRVTRSTQLRNRNTIRSGKVSPSTELLTKLRSQTESEEVLTSRAASARSKFSKYVTFFPAIKHCPAEETGKLFVKNVVKYWGIPDQIVSDSDPRFSGRFWSVLFRLLGSQQHLSTNNHPQTDDQTERFNSMLEEYLRHFINTTKTNWVPSWILHSFVSTSKRVHQPTKAHWNSSLANNPQYHT